MKRLPSRRLMLFYSLESDTPAFLLCKEGRGLVGHEIGLIYQPPSDYLAGYGSRAQDFEVRTLPLPAAEKLHLAWPISRAPEVCIHGAFAPGDRRLTVELQRSLPEEASSPIWGPDSPLLLIGSR